MLEDFFVGAVDGDGGALEAEFKLALTGRVNYGIYL